MSLTGKDAWNAQYFLNGKFHIFRHYTDEITWENLPVGQNVRASCPNLTDEEWNNLMEALAVAAKKQPFSEPYLWQGHVKNEFSRWLRSWRVSR